MKLPPGECHKTSVMISQCGFEACTWFNVNQPSMCRYMASLPPIGTGPPAQFQCSVRRQFRDCRSDEDSQMHYDDVKMGAIASLITSLTTVYSTVYSDADQRKHQSSASLAFVWGIHRGPMNSPAFVWGIHREPVNSPHKWPVTRDNFSIWWRHHEQ